MIQSIVAPATLGNSDGTQAPNLYTIPGNLCSPLVLHHGGRVFNGIFPTILSAPPLKPSKETRQTILMHAAKGAALSGGHHRSALITQLSVSYGALLGS